MVRSEFLEVLRRLVRDGLVEWGRLDYGEPLKGFKVGRESVLSSLLQRSPIAF